MQLSRVHVSLQDPTMLKLKKKNNKNLDLPIYSDPQQNLIGFSWPSHIL